MSDFWDKAKGVIGTVAPTIATALGGPMAGLATRAISEAVLGKPDAGEDEIAQAVMGANPDQLLALKKADHDFKARMAELEVDLERIAASDRDSARKRATATKDMMPAMMALTVVTGFFGILLALIFVEIPPTAKDALYVMLGALGGLLHQIGNYYYGSSAGSSAKQSMIDRLLAKGGK